MGASVIVAKQGEYGAALITHDAFFALPAFPLEAVVDPTGAGDTFAGGFVGSLAQRLDDGVTEDDLRLAMAYGTALASFNVEEFGTERVQRLTTEEIHDRVVAIYGFCRFDLKLANLVAARDVEPARRLVEAGFP